MNQIERLVERVVRACVVAEVELARRQDRDAIEGLRRQVGELERLEARNGERIRALERVNDHRTDYLPAEALERLEAHLERLRAIR